MPTTDSMRFLTIIFKNLARRPLRTSLTVIGIGVAVGAVVALGAICDGFERGFLEVYSSRGVDLVVVRAGLTERGTGALKEGIGEQIRPLPGVHAVAATLMEVVSFEEFDLFGVVVQGWEPESFLFDKLEIRDGRKLTAADGKSVMLGLIFARNLGKHAGDDLEIVEGEVFRIVGIYEGSSVFENGAMVVPLVELQSMMDRADQVTGFSVVADETPEGKNIAALRQSIESLSGGLAAMPAKDYVSAALQIRIAGALAWITSAIALLIGTIGVLNTMIMTLFERTDEIGILRAIGWTKSRVMRLLLLESVMLSLLGAALGILGAVGLTRALAWWSQTGGVVDGQIAFYLIIQGFMIALVVGITGGAYPAFRGAHLMPIEALRSE